MKKANKTPHRSITRVTKYCKKQHICTFWNTPAAPGTPGTLSTPGAEPFRVSSAAVRTPPFTRAGGQDDVSSNKLPKIKFELELSTLGPSVTRPGLMQTKSIQQSAFIAEAPEL